MKERIKNKIELGQIKQMRAQLLMELRGCRAHLPKNERTSLEVLFLREQETTCWLRNQRCNC